MKSTATNKLATLKEIAARITDQVKTVAVLYGGTSGEREISIASGNNVKEVLEAEGFIVVPIDTGTEGFAQELMTNRPDVAFIALHGPGGEDGCIQGFLETLNIPYTHSGVESSAIAMDKEISKILYKVNGLKTAEFITLLKTDEVNAGAIDGFIEQIGLPCVIKPICDGSSLGVSIPKDRDEFVKALDAGFAVSEALMIEEFVGGTEVTVAVIGNTEEELLVLPVIEIVTGNEFYDYDAKYTEGGSTHIIPARISEAEAQACYKAAKDAHALLRCAGLSRTDVIIDASATPWIIETNTVPGMTGTSLVPEAAQHFGLTVGELYRLLLHYALTRDKNILR
jgi:D-alanine-D-alanine ligase